MPLDTIEANTLTGPITDAFTAIGRTDATKMPPTKRNTEPLAWEYHVASVLLRLAEARKKKALAATIKGGVLFDHEKLPKAPGTNEVVYSGNIVEISVAVTTASASLDTDGFVDALEKTGVKRAVLDRLLGVHTTANRAPHKFTSALVMV
jgi:hypothetical protein